MPKTLLFLPYPSASGTWGSTLGLARIALACRRRGHRVVIHACPPTADHLLRLGLEVAEFQGAVPRAGTAPVRSIYDVCDLLGFGDAAFWRRLVAAELDVVAAVRPDALVAHCRLSSPITAARAGLPLATVTEWSTDPRVHSLGDHPLDDLARGLASELAGLRVETLPDLLWSARADAGLATSLPVLEPTLDGVPGITWTGHLGVDGGALPAGLSPPPRLVVAYASSAPWGTPVLLRTMARAAERCGAALWCVTRAGDRPRSLGTTAHVMPYLPLDAVLSHAEALVYHGGKSTTVAAVGHGVPALVVPGAHFERLYNAERLVALGGGVRGELTDLTPARLTPLLEQLLDDPAPRAAAAAAAADAGRFGGADAAALAVERLLEAGRGPGLLPASGEIRDGGR